MSSASQPQSKVESGGMLFGHPSGLYTLFFAEMWERFSYYGMRALLVFYMIKATFLNYSDSQAYAVYGAYTALVYMTPFFGGMIADRLLGARRAVVIGGLLMAAGHLLMTWESVIGFYGALALLIAGNGFFKPNISTIVGSLYAPDSRRRDGGFTIFYMGINLGASMSPLLCGYIGETYGWHWGFGLATIGMLIGLAVFVAPRGVAQVAILAGAVAAAIGVFAYGPENNISKLVNIFVGLALLVAGIVACVALSRGDLPVEAGSPPDREALRRPRWAGLSAEMLVYLGTLVAIPCFALLVSGFALVRQDGASVSLIHDSFIERLEKSDSPPVRVAAVLVRESSRPAGLVLVLAGLGAISYLLFETMRLERIARQRMYVVLILTFFSMLFWSFFEQAGSSVNNFTDRNVDRVFESRTITAEDVGQTIEIQPTQEQLGYPYQGATFTLTDLTALRNEHAAADFSIPWPITEEHIGMGVAERVDEIPASMMQSVNPIYILLFGLVFSTLWTKLGQWHMEPGTPLKFCLGLFQLGLGFAALWYGAVSANERGMVAIHWLLLGYLFQTTGELCISPVGLSMVTKLSPGRLVSTVMGTWFLATAFSQFLAAIIAQFTSVPQEEGGEAVIPAPIETVNMYGDVFGQIAIAAIISGVVCLLLVPRLNRWMHMDSEPGSTDESATEPGGDASQAER